VPSAGSLPEKLKAFPRAYLAELPTPVVFLPHLSKATGRAIYLKRDDSIGPAPGGNKSRALEYLLGEALQLGETKIATFGALQSNHARITAAAARRYGLEPHLFYFARRPPRLTGNLLLAEALGAHMHFVPLGARPGHGMRIETAIRLARVVARARIGRHYFIPVGGYGWRGSLGYVGAAVEIEASARELGLRSPHLVLAAGTGSTLAGLMAGLALCGSTVRPLGVDVTGLWRYLPASIARLASELCARLGAPRVFAPRDVPLIETSGDEAPVYGVPSAAGAVAMERLARLEGIALDRVYTAKAFATLLDLVERRALGSDEPVIFLHTGGLPALYEEPAA
jgi:1-aminocyclopropane-1-carboxylate deaminase/D-cysteine desulfhydrase-like pyridoxal-dependent ACC family enzyme